MLWWGSPAAAVCKPVGIGRVLHVARTANGNGQRRLIEPPCLSTAAGRIRGVHEESTPQYAWRRWGTGAGAVVVAARGCRVKGPWHWGQRLRSSPVHSRSRSSQVRSTGGSTVWHTQDLAAACQLGGDIAAAPSSPEQRRAQNKLQPRTSPTGWLPCNPRRSEHGLVVG